MKLGVRSSWAVRLSGGRKEMTNPKDLLCIHNLYISIFYYYSRCMKMGSEVLEHIIKTVLKDPNLYLLMPSGFGQAKCK